MLANISCAGLRSSELRRAEQGSQPHQDLSLEGWQAELLALQTHGSHRSPGVHTMTRKALRPPDVSRRLVNVPDDAVVEMLEGLVAAHAHLRRLDGFPHVRCGSQSARDLRVQSVGLLRG